MCCLNPSKVHNKIFFAIYIESFSKCIFSSDLTSWKAALLSSRKKLALQLNQVTELAISEVCQIKVGPAWSTRHLKERCWHCLVGEEICNTIFIESCDVGSRPRLLLHCLNCVGLWPITSAIEASIVDFQNGVDLLLLPSGQSLFHDCTAEEGCPLLEAFVGIKSSTKL